MSIAGTLPSRCRRETGGEHKDMLLERPAYDAATHAHSDASYLLQIEGQLDW